MIVLLLSLIYWYFLVRRASNIVRWQILIFTVLGAFSTVVNIIAGAYPYIGILQVLMSLLAWVTSIAACVYLCAPEARDWLASRGNRAARDSAIFD
ncbi:hypothetical protein [Novosphingobium colocasiae]|nr:hypothetical protein [Novosphingobium colocasiae]